MPDYVSREQLIRALPYARRYARALSGNQQQGDSLVADALKDWLAAEQAGAEGMADRAGGTPAVGTLLPRHAPVRPRAGRRRLRRRPVSPAFKGNSSC